MLRQQYALVSLGLFRNQKIVLNFDETWVPQMDFRRMKWRAPGSTNSVPMKMVAPRISLVVAIDTLGNMYACFTQANTDSKVMGLFIRELVKRLDADRPTWRENTVWLHDGARYFNNTSIQAVLKSLRIPIVISAPYSYNLAPSELVFAAMKSTHLNLEQLPTGKGNFLNVVRLVLARLREIRPSQRLLFWHHILQHLYRYLDF